MTAPTWLQALILGLVQGLTEFIPVSSSAHLVLVPAYLGWERPGLAFDVALHVGTLLALLVYYRRDLSAMASAAVSRDPSPHREVYRRLLGLLALASLPVAVAGLTFRSAIEVAFESPRLASALLFGTATLLLAGEWLRRRRTNRVRVSPCRSEALRRQEGLDLGADPDDPTGTDLRDLRARQALLVGFGQALALLPGLSRSGTTITAGMAAGLTRPAATRFAFLLALPAISGATLVSLRDMGDLGAFTAMDLAIGMMAAAVSGYVAIWSLVRLVARAGLQRFVIYLVLLGAVGLVYFD